MKYIKVTSSVNVILQNNKISQKRRTYENVNICTGRLFRGQRINIQFQERNIFFCRCCTFSTLHHPNVIFVANESSRSQLRDGEMEITKNKNPWARPQIFYRFLNPYTRVWFSFWKSQTFGKTLEAFGSRIFFLRFLISIGWSEFSHGFLVVAQCINYSLLPPPHCTVVHILFKKNRYNFANWFCLAVF